MKNEEASRINTAAQEYAMEATPLTREILEEAYRDGRKAEYYHQEAVIAAKDKEIERLKALCLKQFNDMMDDARKQGATAEIIAARRPQYIKENNL